MTIADSVQVNICWYRQAFLPTKFENDVSTIFRPDKQTMEEVIKQVKVEEFQKEDYILKAGKFAIIVVY